MEISRRHALALIGAAASLPALAACGEPELTDAATVTVMLDWVPNTNHTGLYVARANGYYTDENLTVTLVEPGAGTAENSVASGAADFGVSFQENVTLARIKNRPIVSVAAVIQHNTSGFASPVDRAIRRPRDFAGKKYGAFGMDIERQVLSALMECDQGDFSAIEFVDIGATDSFVAWERGDVDFIWIFEGWTGIEAGLRGVDLDFMRLNDLDCVPDYYTPVLITGEQMIAERPDVVRRWIRATARGYQFAIDQPDAAGMTALMHASASGRTICEPPLSFSGMSQRQESFPNCSSGSTLRNAGRPYRGVRNRPTSPQFYSSRAGGCRRGRAPRIAGA